MKIILLAFLGVLLLNVTITTAQGDITPPELVELAIEPGHINTIHAPQTITLTARFTDDLSGFLDGFIIFVPEIGTTQSHAAYFGGGWNEVMEGDNLDGIYMDTMTLPQFAAEGWWTIRQLSLVDIVGNRRDYYETSSDGFPEHLHDFRFYNGETITEPTPPHAPSIISKRIYLPTVNHHIPIPVEPEHDFPFTVGEGRCEPNMSQTYFQGYVRDSNNNPINGVCVHVHFYEPRNTKCSGCDGVGDGNWGFSPFGGPAPSGTPIEIFVVECDGEMLEGGQNQATGFGNLTPQSPKWTRVINESEQCTGITFYRR